LTNAYKDESWEAVWLGECDVWQVGGLVTFATSQDIGKAVADRKFWRNFKGETHSLLMITCWFKAALAAGLA
jgi:hypothetical protein